MAKKKLGRPTKMTAEVVEKLEDALKFGSSVTEACYLSGVSRDFFYQHYQSNQDFSDKMERARGWLSIQAKHTLANSILNGDVKSSIWLLDKKDHLPSTDIINEIPEEERWDDADNESLERYVKTRIQMALEEIKSGRKTLEDFT